MKLIYIPWENKERPEVEKSAIELYDLKRKIQYHAIRNEFHFAEELLKNLYGNQARDLGHMFGFLEWFEIK